MFYPPNLIINSVYICESIYDVYYIYHLFFKRYQYMYHKSFMCKISIFLGGLDIFTNNLFVYELITAF